MVTGSKLPKSTRKYILFIALKKFKSEKAKREKSQQQLLVTMIDIESTISDGDCFAIKCGRLKFERARNDASSRIGFGEVYPTYIL